MKIGELASASDTLAETIRFYELKGLLPAPARTESNYRIYDEEHLARLQFIRHCRGLDMTLDEIRILLHLKSSPKESCGDVNAVLDAHIGNVSRRIRELSALERDLKELRSQCGDARQADQCGILEVLATASDGRKRSTTGHLQRVHRRG